MVGSQGKNKRKGQVMIKKRDLLGRLKELERRCYEMQREIDLTNREIQVGTRFEDECVCDLWNGQSLYTGKKIERPFYANVHDVLKALVEHLGVEFNETPAVEKKIVVKKKR